MINVYGSFKFVEVEMMWWFYIEIGKWYYLLKSSFWSVVINWGCSEMFFLVSLIRFLLFLVILDKSFFVLLWFWDMVFVSWLVGLIRLDCLIGMFLGIKIESKRRSFFLVWDIVDYSFRSLLIWLIIVFWILGLMLLSL